MHLFRPAEERGVGGKMVKMGEQSCRLVDGAGGWVAVVEEEEGGGEGNVV